MTTQLLCIALCCSAVFAQTVTGTVVTPLGVPIAGVTLEFSNGTAPLTPVTNALGQFVCTVQAGAQDIDFLPPSVAYAPTQLAGVAVPAVGSISLGTIVLQNGVALSGTVLSGGLPLSGADINVYSSLTGAKLFIQNDATSVAGTYTVIVPAGTYDVRAAPPIGMILVAQFAYGVQVGAATTCPTLSLPAGVQLSGTVRNAITNAVVADVDIDVDDYFTGTRIATPSDNTNALGVFSVIVPAGIFNITLDPPPNLALQARQFIGIPVPSTVNVGNLTLQPGFLITGTVVSSTGVPVSGTDLDVDTSPGQFRVYTANDTTLPNGTFSMVVPSGTYTLSALAPVGSTLTGAMTAPFTVTGNVALGNVTLPQGVLLSGSLTNFFTLPEANCDIDLLNPITGASYPLTSDLSSVNGTYSVRVPQGVWDVRFKTSKVSLMSDALVPGVSIAAAGLALNQSLPLKHILVYFNSLAPSTTVPQGTPISILAGIYVPGGLAPVNGVMVLSLIDPSGVETQLFSPLNMALPAQFFAIWQGLPVPLPAINPAHAGKAFRLKARITNGTVVNPVVHDSDEFTFTIL